MRYLILYRHFRTIALLCAASLLAGGCSMQMSKSEQPDWSLNGPKETAKPAKKPANKYGDWSSQGAPKPLTYETDR